MPISGVGSQNLIGYPQNAVGGIPSAVGAPGGIPGASGVAGLAGTGGVAGLAGTAGIAGGANPAANPIAPGGQLQQGPALQLLQMMMQMMQLVMQLLLGGGQQQQFSRALPGEAGGGGSVPGTAQSLGGGIPDLSPNNNVGPLRAPAGPVNTNSDNPQLQQSLQAIANDPEGRVLLAEAQRRGVSISVGDTGGSNILGFYQSNGRGGGRIVVGDGSNIKTIVHELVHAVTPEDGNSQHEEGTANIIGDRVASRLLGRPQGNTQQIYNRTLPLYQDLTRFNNIEQSLGRLGIVA